MNKDIKRYHALYDKAKELRGYCFVPFNEAHVVFDVLLHEEAEDFVNLYKELFGEFSPAEHKRIESILLARKEKSTLSYANI